MTTPIPRTPIVNGVRTFPYTNVPYTNITPFTQRDGVTYLEQVENIKAWIQNDLIPHVDDTFSTLVEAWADNVTELVGAVNAQLDAQNTAVLAQLAEQNNAIAAQIAEQNDAVSAQLADNLAAVNNAVQQVINNSIEVQDPLVAILMGDDTSATRTATDTVIDGKLIPYELTENVDGTVSGLVDDDNSALNASLPIKYMRLTDADGYISGVVSNPESELNTALREGYQSRGSSVVMAADFGLTPGPGADNTAVLTEAMAYAVENGSKVVQLPSGVFYTNSLEIPDGVTLRGAGKGSTVLHRTEQVNGPLVNIRGSVEELMPLTQLAARGATTLTVANTAGINPGDILVIHDQAAYSTDSVTYRSGEQVRVKSIVNANTIELWGMVRGGWAGGAAYTIGNSASIGRITPKTGGVCDMTIQNDPDIGGSGIDLVWAEGVTISNVEIRGGGGFGIRIDGCRDTTITGVTVKDLKDDVSGGFAGYAMTATGPTENLTITGCQVSRVRHGFTTQANAWGMPHNVSIVGNVYNETTLAAVDMHAAGDGFTIAANTIQACKGGISIRGRNVNVDGNTISNIRENHGIIVAEESWYNVVIQNNMISYIHDNQNGIVARERGAGILTIANNTLFNIGGPGIQVRASISHVTIKENTVRNTNLVTTAAAITTSAPTGSDTNGTAWLIADNLIVQTSGSASRAIDVTANGPADCTASGNRAYGSFSAATFAVPKVMMNRKIDENPPAVTGSRGNNAALTSLLTTLANLGIITNSTSI